MNRNEIDVQNEETTDASLMAELADQKPAALEALFHKYGATLRSVVLRVLHDETEADDVVQEVLVELWARAENYSAEKGKPLGWLVTLARRRAIDKLRQRQAYRRATERFELEYRRPKQELADSGPVSDQVANEDLREWMESLLKRLPSPQEQAIRLVYFQRMSQREVATATQLPLGTVKTRIELGLHKLEMYVQAAKDKAL